MTATAASVAAAEAGVSAPPAATASAQVTRPLLAYCASSVAMTLLNKLIVKTCGFRLGFITLLLQDIVTLLLLQFCLRANVISFKPVRRDMARQWLPVSLLLCAMLFSGIKALQYISIPLYTIFKNLTIIAIAYGEYFIWGTRVTALMLVSFFLMFASAVLGGYTDIQFDLVGYLWMFINCVLSAAYVLCLRVAVKTTGFSEFETVYYNNALALPILIVLSMWDWATVVSASDTFDATVLTPRLGVLLLCSGINSFLLSFTSVWCVRATSSTTYSMVGAVNKLPVTIAGMVVFPDNISVGGVIGIITGFVAGVLYVQAKATATSTAELNPRWAWLTQYAPTSRQTEASAAVT